MVHSPIVIDLTGEGFHFTSLQNGVTFTLAPADTRKSQVSWTAQDSSNAWLVLDRNGNGTIDNLGEMFGNITPQPPPPSGKDRNGFLALAVFDTPEYGGNGDGENSKLDEIFPMLQVWQDANHNGFSEPSELRSLTSVGIRSISLTYEDSPRVDRYGNQFRYHSRVVDEKGADTSKTAWDVYLLAKPVPLPPPN